MHHSILKTLAVISSFAYFTSAVASTAFADGREMKKMEVSFNDASYISADADEPEIFPEDEIAVSQNSLEEIMPEHLLETGWQQDEYGGAISDCEVNPDESEWIPAYELTDEEYDLLARVVTAEAENQGFEAQYLIACVVMNRVASDEFPDSVSEVIWQKNQFSSMWNGRYDRSVTTDSCYEAVQYMIEYGNELPEDVLFFTSCGYLPGTEPYMQVNDMYFSKLKEK